MDCSSPFTRSVSDGAPAGCGTTMLVYLVGLVCFVYLVDLVHLVSFVQPNKRDKPNKPNNVLRTLADFSSILLDPSG
jgi:hypothetical protein